MNFSELFRRWGSVEEHKASKVIFREHKPAEVMFVILSGEIELSLKGETVAIEGEGGFIGEMAMVPSTTHSTTATARSAVKLARMDRQQLADLAATNPEFSLHVMAVLAKRLRAVDKYITSRLGQAH